MHKIDCDEAMLVELITAFGTSTEILGAEEGKFQALRGSTTAE